MTEHLMQSVFAFLNLNLFERFLKESGPLAVASASPAGSEPMLKLNRTQLKEWDIAVAFDNGALKSGPSSSIVDFSEGHPRIIRAGAISVAEMTEVVPLIFV
jgi:L-threonylcarbamoyladenylate synthase